MNKSVSVIIPAYNCEKTITAAIQAVLSQDYHGPIELIIVDDGSIDATPVIVKTFSEVKYFRQNNSGPAAARNKGALLSAGEILFFTDSDCIPRPDWISKAIAHLQEPKIAVVAGSYDIVNVESLLANCIQNEILYRHHHKMPAFPKSFGSYNFCVRKNVFLEVGGFNESYPHASGEDNDLSYKILGVGYRIYFERSAIVSHHHTESLFKYLKEQFRHGFWRVKMYRDHPQMAAGDDYTFWKDIVEPPLVISIAIQFFMGCLMDPSFFVLSICCIFLLAILEIFYATITMKTPLQAGYWMIVMSLRAFSRTIGFLAGISLIFTKKSPKIFK